jgi:hypothetical protein
MTKITAVGVCSWVFVGAISAVGSKFKDSNTTKHYWCASTVYMNSGTEVAH